jgi:hypothetical protein
MTKNYLLKYLLVIAILSNMAFECGCKKTAKQISHLNVSVTFKQAVIYLEDGRVPFTLTIKSNDELAKDLKYTCVDWLVKDNVGKLVGASGEAIDPGYELVYGDNQLYYQPHTVGNHMLEITVSDENGILKKKQLVSLSVKDHLPIDFQIELKPEKSSVFVHEPVKLVLDISSRHKEAAQLTYQIKEISSDKKGIFSAIAQGNPLSPNHDLSYGKNILYYNNIDKQAGIHDIKLIVANSKGDTQTISASLSILDTDFQVKLQLQKPSICFYEKAKLIVDITSSQVGLDKLDYQIKAIGTNAEGGEFLSTTEGNKISPGHALVYGKNTLYYQPNGQLGIHEIKLIVTNSNGNTQTVLALLEVHNADFQVKLKPEKPTIFFYEQAKIKIDITSPQEGGDKLNYQIQELSTNKKGYFSLTAEGKEISGKQTLSYGKSELYYHPKEQLGTHDIKLVVTNGNGVTKTVLASLAVIDVDFQVKLKPEKPTIFFYEQAKIKLEITSPQEGGDKLNYQIQELNTNKKGYFSLTAEGKEMNEKQTLSCGKSELYYHPKEQLGTHDIKLVVTNGNGNTKTVSASLQVLDIDFQVNVKPETTQSFPHDPVKLIVDISSKQEGGEHLSCQLKAINTNIKGGEFLTAATDGTSITTGQTLNYGTHTWYYIPHQPGKHDIQLIAVSSHGTTKETTVSLDVRDPDFQLEIKPDKTPVFSHEQPKLTINISSTQGGVDNLVYELKEVNTNIEAGQLSATPEGIAVSLGQALKYGKNSWYYDPHQPGKHTIQVTVVNNKGTTKKATAVLMANQAIFATEVKIEKPAKSTDATWELGLLLGSNSGLKEEKWELASWQMEEPGMCKLQGVDGYQVAEKGVLLQPGLNKLKFILSEEMELKNVPQLKLTIRQPDGKDKALIVDLSQYVFPYLEKGIGPLIEQHQIACKKVENKEPFAQDKLDRVNTQINKLRSNLNILAQSTTVNRDQLEDALTRTDPEKLNSKSTVEVSEWYL